MESSLYQLVDNIVPELNPIWSLECSALMDIRFMHYSLRMQCYDIDVLLTQQLSMVKEEEDQYWVRNSFHQTRESY